jgi:hypothetical protein
MSRLFELHVRSLLPKGILRDISDGICEIDTAAAAH